ncbi:MAG: iron complex outerrane recepter protein [Acidobacteriota bacterium]|nr:iron complex outerrane recepter protein [Acidobacteriota bacterium]
MVSNRSTALLLSAARLLACILCCLLFFTSSHAQSSIARVEGIVQDQTGAPVKDAEVTLSKESTVIAKAMTDPDGHFQMEAATTPDETLTIRAQGFTPFESKLDQIQTNSPEIKITLAPALLSEQVTVTATRTGTRLGDTAASIATLSSTDLSTTAAETLDDTLRQVPGFSLFRRSGSRTANPTSQGVSLRGVGASGASRAVVLADGVPLNDPFGGWVYWSRVPRASVQSIEVLRGGASNLYGSAALGGVVNIFTRQPQAHVLLLETSYGNQQTADASLFAGGRRGDWGASIAAETFRTDGYIIVDKSERGRIDTKANSRNAVINLTVERSFSKIGSAFARASFFGEARSNGAPLQTNRTHIRQFVTGSDFQTRQAGAFSLRAYGGTQLFDQNFSAVSADRNLETLTRLQRVPAQSTGISLQWSRAIEKRQTLVAGIEAIDARGTSDELVFVSGRASSTVTAGGRERTVGLFLEDIIRLAPTLYLTIGARIDRWRNHDALSTTRPLNTSAPATTSNFADRNETAFSPQLSLLYKAANNVSLYASLSRAFRAPTLNELYRTFRVGDVLTLANENLLAERLTGGETGASFNAFKQKLNVRGTFFWTEITRPVANVTLRVQPGLITRQRENLGRTRSRGLELEWDARLTNRLTVSGGYLLADAKVLSFPANTALEGLLIPQVPRHQLTFQACYRNPSLITIGLQGRASGAQFDDDQNRLRLDKYFTLDALVSRSITRKAEVFVASENLFNQRYTVGLTPVKTIGPPLVIRFGFRLHLGSR